MKPSGEYHRRGPVRQRKWPADDEAARLAELKLLKASNTGSQELPTLEEIEAMAAAIRAGWSKKQSEWHARGMTSQTDDDRAYQIPVVSTRS